MVVDGRVAGAIEIALDSEQQSFSERVILCRTESEAGEFHLPDGATEVGAAYVRRWSCEAPTGWPVARITTCRESGVRWSTTREKS